MGLRPSTVRKRRAVLDAAETVFLRDGYLGATLDDVVALSGVSRQTIYNQFGNKEELFVALVSDMTHTAGDGLHDAAMDLSKASDLPLFLAEYAEQQLTVVMTPRLLRLRRLVIGEVERFPDLARALWENGPQRAMDAMERLFAELSEAGLLHVDDPAVAASTFNWLVMGGPTSAAMLLGDDAAGDSAAKRRHVAEAVRVFLAAYPPTSDGS